MILNSIGKIVDRFWRDIPSHYPNIEHDYYVIILTCPLVACI